jgi:predicted Zn-dependent protease
VRYVVIYYGNMMWIFKGASRTGTEAPSGDAFFLSTANTFRRMRASEFALAEPYRLHVMRAADGTTMEQLAEQSPIKKYPLQQLRLYNKLYPDGEPKPGELVKTVR